MKKNLYHPDPELDAQIRQSPAAVQQYILALHAENKRLQAQIAKLQAQQLTAQNRIPPDSPNHPKKRAHNIDMVELRKFYHDILKPTSGEPEEPDS